MDLAGDLKTCSSSATIGRGYHRRRKWGKAELVTKEPKTGTRRLKYRGVYPASPSRLIQVQSDRQGAYAMAKIIHESSPERERIRDAQALTGEVGRRLTILRNFSCALREDHFS